MEFAFDNKHVCDAYKCSNDECSCVDFNVYFDNKDNRVYFKCKMCGSTVVSKFNGCTIILNNNEITVDKKIMGAKLMEKNNENEVNEKTNLKMNKIYIGFGGDNVEHIGKITMKTLMKVAFDNGISYFKVYTINNGVIKQITRWFDVNNESLNCDVWIEDLRVISKWHF